MYQKHLTGYGIGCLSVNVPKTPHRLWDWLSVNVPKTPHRLWDWLSVCKRTKNTAQQLMELHYDVIKYIHGLYYGGVLMKLVLQLDIFLHSNIKDKIYHKLLSHIYFSLK